MRSMKCVAKRDANPIGCHHMNRPKSKQPLPNDANSVYKGMLFEVFQWEQMQFNGSKKTFEKVVRPDTVIVIPVLDSGKILLCEQIQPGREKYYSFYGGRIEINETPEYAARRELFEESGLVADNMNLLESFQPIAKVEWAIYICCIRSKTNS